LNCQVFEPLVSREQYVYNLKTHFCEILKDDKKTKSLKVVMKYKFDGDKFVL